MFKYIDQYGSSTVNRIDSIIQNFDPSLFQNIILGILAIFIPFAIVFLIDILDSKKKRSEFEKMVLSDEVLGTKKVFGLSVVGIIFFSFFTGKDISFALKIVAIFAGLIIVRLFWTPFKKILKFSEGYTTEFEISFLKKLKFANIFKYRNKYIAEKMLRAWKSFLSEKSEFNEYEFTKIFISHVNHLIEQKEFEFAIQLSQTYVQNIKKRDGLSMSHEILPKIFEWNEILWNEQQLWLKGYDTEKRIQNFISQKYFPTVRTWVLKIFKKTNLKRDNFWNWQYYCGEFFQAIIKALLIERNRPYQLFLSFKKHVEKSENKLDKIYDEKEKEKYWHYITRLFGNFCPTFFDEIDNAPSNYGIWNHDFPQDWKISMSNKEKRIPRIILHEFLQWSQIRVFKQSEDSSFDKNLTNVIKGTFPNVHPSLFRAFLMLFFAEEVKYALEEKPNFYILSGSVSWTGSIEESREDREKKIAEMMRKKEISQKEETIQLILNFFHFWKTLTIYKDNLTEEESKDWKNFTEEQRQLIIKRVRKEKLEKIKQEIESAEVKNICKDSEQKKLYRKNFLELIELLIIEVDK